MEDNKNVAEVKSGAGSPREAEETPGKSTQNGEIEAQQPLKRSNSAESGGAGHKPPEETPRRRFQIPRKSRDKRALQIISSGSREFEEILKILHSSYLDANSKANFSYKCARLVHNEFLEKEFTEKRRQLKFDGRLDKELADSYTFLMVDLEQMHSIVEKGLHVGHSRMTTLGKPSMGVYLSRYADLLQANPLETGTTGDIFIFKVIKGKMKYVFDHIRSNQMDSFSANGGLDPVPKHECHVLKNMNAVTALLGYRAFERTQYYFYEYGFDDVLKRPRHVCPYAVVSFGYRDELATRQPSLPASGPVSFPTERSFDRSSFTLWRGQLLNKGKLLCYASLKSTSGPFIPYRLPDKLDLDIVIKIEQIKKSVPAVLFYKETHNKPSEAKHGGIYSRLYEVVEKTRTGSHLQGLLQKIERENLALVKPLDDRGFMFLFFPSPMTSSYAAAKTRLLHALFIYHESRVTLPVANVSVPPSFMPESHEFMPEFLTFVPALHFALHKSQSDTSADFNDVVEKHSRVYLKRRAEIPHKSKEYILKPYDSRLDYKKSLYVAPRNKGHIESALRSYIFGSEAYTISVDKAKEMVKENQRFQQFSPVSDYEPVEDDHDSSKYNKKAPVSYTETKSEKASENTDWDIDKINGLINLIQKKKQSKPETDEPSSVGVKRKRERHSENVWKPRKCEENFHHDNEPGESAQSLISSMGGQDTDLRQETPEPLTSEYLKMLLEKLADSCMDPALVQSLKSLKQNTTEELPAQKLENVSLAAHDTEREAVRQVYEDQTSDYQENTTSFSEEAQEAEGSHSDPLVPMEENILDPPLESASPCLSHTADNICPMQGPNSLDLEMHWKLIPIAGEEARTPEDHVGTLRDEKTPELNLTKEQLVYVSTEDALPNDPRAGHKRRVSRYSPLRETGRRRPRHDGDHCRSRTAPSRTERNMLQSKHCHNGLIENTVLEIYNTFSEQLHDVLKQRDVPYMVPATPPLLSSDDRVLKLSDCLYEQASDICVQQYVDDLHTKLDNVVAIHINSCAISRTLTPVTEIMASPGVHPFHPTQTLTEYPHAHHHLHCDVREEHPFSADHVDKVGEENAANGNEPSHHSRDLSQETPEISAPNVTDLSAPHLAISNLINQINPEVFNNLVKIITHVNKNSVKFYIHSEEENTICQNIKEYLLKLGNAECRPEKFLESKTKVDKLLIIIQNEDIPNCIHRVPALVLLKRLPSVSFAGVDSLDDLKNHTYNEIFVSGGFIVSDESVLNPETVSADELKKFLLFLEEINSPDANWQWKVHYKFHKRLKELGRVNANALNILTLLTTYQKKNLVEILSYHLSCDPQNQPAPQLECLIKLQVQYMKQRHVIFLTEKDAARFPDYCDNGIVVTRMVDFMDNFSSLIGHHSSNNEEHRLSQLTDEGDETAPGEADVKEEEDMSLDSEDDTPPIEVCSDSRQPESPNQNISSALVDKDQTESPSTINQSKTPTLDELQPITPVSVAGSTTGENSVSTGDELGNTTQDYNRDVNLSHQFSHFNVLTHQTFLGSMYPALSNPAPAEICFMNSCSQQTEPEKSHNSECKQK
ncbi:transcription activation suppressor L homeolog isoform X2 [Xenopus laevis]|uniref:Transcription activation suppressor L homeolog isoform X2 n=1 Tax=Xenopus laevis TaxID=8355 RepID=A0A8J0U6D1_XENLA|nr:transcription activation suppressor L homeolog isoform X2 [Xenopus laevis]